MQRVPVARMIAAMRSAQALIAVVLVAGSGLAQTGRPAGALDIVIRHGTVIDGSGRAGFAADVGIRGGYIVAVGDLGATKAATEIEARGLYVTPGFINIHSHAAPNALPTAINMLTQGVTTEIINADGQSPPDVARQMASLGTAGLAVNVGGYIGFNSAWQNVVGAADRRPTADDIAKMRSFITAGLAQGAWGVSAGLDYKPAYFARTQEVIDVVSAARNWRTNFTNHDRLTPESNFSSRVGIEETLAIGKQAGLVPVVTHMKVQGHEQGTASDRLASIHTAATRGAYTAADAYPYLAGQSSLGALIVPGWAQEGGRAAMLQRFADPATRARIVTEAEQAMTARFGGPQGVYLTRTQRELTDVMKEMQTGPGETVLKILEQGDPGAILRFGIEADLIEILKDPVTSMACDCGASTDTRVHPRFYGSFPRVLGRYVREQHIMSWEEAIRKSTSLPAATIGMVDRGLIRVGMAADVTVFDPRTVIDHSTYEEPALPSEGIRFVLVNGQVALADGQPTGAKAGRALTRTINMPSRPSGPATPGRMLSIKGSASDRSIAITVSRSTADGMAKGSANFDATPTQASITIDTIGFIQTAGTGWTSFTGLTRASSAGGARAVTVIVDEQDPNSPGNVTVIVMLEGAPPWSGTMSAKGVSIIK
jgi:N-acyl-D-aspartate/D-glutamate deacylase